MRRDVTGALRLSLQGHLSLRKSRLESFCVLVVGVLLSRTVNLSHLACMFPTQAEIASNYRRLQRFFAQVILVSVREHLESLESLMIPWWRSDSQEPPDVDEREPRPV
jgi:hypothetical protein